MKQISLKGDNYCNNHKWPISHVLLCCKSIWKFLKNLTNLLKNFCEFPPTWYIPIPFQFQLIKRAMIQWPFSWKFSGSRFNCCGSNSRVSNTLPFLISKSHDMIFWQFFLIICCLWPHYWTKKVIFHLNLGFYFMYSTEVSIAFFLQSVDHGAFFHYDIAPQ